MDHVDLVPSGLPSGDLEPLTSGVKYLGSLMPDQSFMVLLTNVNEICTVARPYETLGLVETPDPMMRRMAGSNAAIASPFFDPTLKDEQQQIDRKPKVRLGPHGTTLHMAARLVEIGQRVAGERTLPAIVNAFTTDKADHQKSLQIRRLLFGDFIPDVMPSRTPLRSSTRSVNPGTARAGMADPKAGHRQ